MPELQPGFMVIHANQPESLREILLAWMREHPLAPLENEILLVQSNGIAQWLKIAMARPRAEGGLGIAAALDMQLPSRFQWQAYRALLGADAVPESSPFDESLLVWRLMRLLPALLDRPDFAPLREFLREDTDLRRRHQLAARLADLFDQYQVYRADWLAAWASGNDVLPDVLGMARDLPPEQRWQPELWRALQADIGGTQTDSSRAAIHQRFLAAARTRAADDCPAGLPRRLMVFGISSMPRQTLEVLAAIARWTQVLMCVHNPCEHYWADIIAGKDLLRSERRRQRPRAGTPAELGDEALHLHAHPLLASWGKQGRDFIRLLDEHDDHASYAGRFAGQRVDLFTPTGGGSLLRELQDDVLALRPLHETQARWPALRRDDDSIRFHLAHSPQREVEILHDQLLRALAEDASLTPRDIIVMLPDLASYAPHIAAVFGLHAANDPRHIRFSVADQGQRKLDPLLVAIETLLGLPESRFEVSTVRELLDVGVLRARFGIREHELALVSRWIAAANIRWGLDAHQRASLDLPPDELNSWAFGLRRLMLGYANGNSAPWQEIVPMDEVGGLEAALLGPLARFIEALEASWHALRAPQTPQEWGLRLRALLERFFLAEAGDSHDAFTLARLDDILQDWLDACAAAGLAEPLPLNVVREHWLGELDRASLSQPFFAGTLTFATLMPMRAIPFRRVCLLGMNDGDYPRNRPPLDFDLMGHDYRPGDRSRREDDRYLFLEALLSAREHLHISWVARSALDNSERAPSVLVAQLREHLAAGWRAESGDLLAQISVEHPLQPFNPVYFDGSDARLFSYAREWAPAAGETATPATPAALEPLPGRIELDLAALTAFLKDPVREFFRRRLAVSLDLADSASADAEPFALDKLETWSLQNELLQVQRRVPLTADEAVAQREAVRSTQLRSMQLRGELPAGAFGELSAEDLAAPMEALFEQYTAAILGAGEAHAAVPVRHDCGDLRVEDSVDELFGPDAKLRRICLHAGKLFDKKKPRHDKLIAFWICQLALNAQGIVCESRVFAYDGTIHLRSVQTDVAQSCWNAVLEAWRTGLCAPLPFTLGSALAWLLAKAGKQADDALEALAKESAYSLYLQRAWPDQDALIADPAFVRLAETLLRPLIEHCDGAPA